MPDFLRLINVHSLHPFNKSLRQNQLPVLIHFHCNIIFQGVLRKTGKFFELFTKRSIFLNEGSYFDSALKNTFLTSTFISMVCCIFMYYKIKTLSNQLL